MGFSISLVCLCVIIIILPCFVYVHFFLCVFMFKLGCESYDIMLVRCGSCDQWFSLLNRAVLLLIIKGCSSGSGACKRCHVFVSWTYVRDVFLKQFDIYKYIMHYVSFDFFNHSCYQIKWKEMVWLISS